MNGLWFTRLPGLLFLLTFLGWGLVACERPDPAVTILASPMPLLPTPLLPPEVTPLAGSDVSMGEMNVTATIVLPPLSITPTPDPPHHTNDGDTTAFLVHYVAAGETLGYIAQLYGSSIAEMQTVNQLSDSDLLQVGQELRVPTIAENQLISPDYKIIPDSELVYGPAAAGFDVSAFAGQFNGFLLTYQEVVEEQLLTGPEVVTLVAQRYSVNPRLLLAILEYRAGAVTQPVTTNSDYLLGHTGALAEGLYGQLSWAANQLNWGFYGRAEAGVTSFLLGKETRIAISPIINNGTAGVQLMLAAHDTAVYETWRHDVGPDGLFATYYRLFGNPFDQTIDPLWPADLAQPPFRIPWASKETWYFTGGPHGGWAAGSAWAALDFAPPGDQLGCVTSDAWVLSMSDGLVTRSDFGAVVVDLDGNGYAGTGWAVTYMHLESRDRIPVGSIVQAGDRLGHASCEGGFSNGTHVHLARTYNGRWVSADGLIPFEMGGWVSQGTGREYDGFLVRGGISKEACECRDEINGIPGE